MNKIKKKKKFNKSKVILIVNNWKNSRIFKSIRRKVRLIMYINKSARHFFVKWQKKSKLIKEI
jgi:hypothetical protein